MVAMVLAMVLGADPVAVLVQSRSGLSQEDFKKASSALDDQLTKAVPSAWTLEDSARRLKVNGAPDAASCKGKMPCLVNLAARLNAPTLVALSVSVVGRDRAWVLAAFEVKTNTQLAREEWLDETGQDVTPSVQKFAERLAVVLKPAPPPTPPLVTTPKETPPPVAGVTPQPPIVIAPVEPEPSKVLPKVLLTSAAVTGTGALVTGILSIFFNAEAQRTVTVGNQRISLWTTDQAKGLVDTSNGLAVTAVVLAVVAAGLGVGTVLTW